MAGGLGAPDAIDLGPHAAGAALDAAGRMPGARFVEIPSDWGHQSASMADPAAAAFLNQVIGGFLQRPMSAQTGREERDGQGGPGHRHERQDRDPGSDAGPAA